VPSQGRRSTPLPGGWTRIRRRILRRDSHRCQWPLTTGPCGDPATDVDHKTPAWLGGTDDDTNLWALCGYHHDTKTAREASAAAHALPPRDRPTETHPGLLP
jgi:5-methylcytosine-specific restriction protein A